MTKTTEERLTRLETQMEAVYADLAEMKADLKAIRTALAEARGGWRTLLAVAGLSGAIGAFLAKVAPFLRVG